MLTVWRHTLPTLLSRTDRIKLFSHHVCESEACLETSTRAGPSDLINFLWSHTNCGPSRGLLYCRSTHVIITMIFRLWCTGM